MDSKIFPEIDLGIRIFDNDGNVQSHQRIMLYVGDSFTLSNSLTGNAIKIEGVTSDEKEKIRRCISDLEQTLLTIAQNERVGR